MHDLSIQQVSPNSTALNAEHYQSFEMAKANDGIIGGDDIAQIRSYAAFARAQAQAVHKSIASMSALEDVTATKAEMTETAQTFAKVSVYADQRIGEILRELPKAKNQHDKCSVGTPTKHEAEKQANLDHHTAYDLQKMAANPEVVEAVIAKAEQDGRVVSRAQVLKEIDERKRAERELRKASVTQTNLEMEAESLRQQLAQRPDPEVIEREVVPEETQRRIRDLERENRRLNDEYQQMWRKKREADAKLDQANELLGEKERNNNAQRDIEHLTVATNSYLRNYGGKAWAFDQFDRVDEMTQREFAKAINSLAAFAQGLSEMIRDKKQLGA